MRSISTVALALVLAAGVPTANGRTHSIDWVDWGAVAMGPRGAFGLALHYDNERDAVAAALADCQGGCNRTLGFHNSCGAIAVGTKGAESWAVARTLDLAQRHAMQGCALEGARCSVRVKGCTD